MAQFQPGGASQSTHGRLRDGDGLRAILAGSGDNYTEFYLLAFAPCSGFPDTCQEISVAGLNLGLADLDVAAGLDSVAAMSDGQAAPDGALWAFTVAGTMNVLGTSTESESATP